MKFQVSTMDKGKLNHVKIFGLGPKWIYCLLMNSFSLNHFGLCLSKWGEIKTTLLHCLLGKEMQWNWNLGGILIKVKPFMILFKSKNSMYHYFTGVVIKNCFFFLNCHWFVTLIIKVLRFKPLYAEVIMNL